MPQQSHERETVDFDIQDCFDLKVLYLDTNHVLGNVVNGDDSLVVPKKFK